MRRFPSSWTTTLTKLGFRRRTARQKHVDRHYMRRRPQMESLEERAMLDGDTSFTSDDQDAPTEYTSFSTVGAIGSQWIDNGSTSNTFQNDRLHATGGTGTKTATWSFTDLSPGFYQVSTTWQPHPSNRNTAAPYEIFDGSTLLTTEYVNQRLAPDSDILVGAQQKNFQHLGGPIEITGSSLNVTLSNNGSGYVIADAVHIQRLFPPELQTNSLTLEEGETVVLSLAEISASDEDASATELDALLFTVSNVTGGYFTDVNAPSTPITSFTQEEVEGGDIQFVHDDEEGAPSYDVTVSDGQFSDGPSAAAISFTSINDDPTNAGSLPGEITVTGHVTSSVDLSSIDLSDVDAGSGELIVTLATSTGGELTATEGTGIIVGGTPTALTLTGTLADLNSYLDTASNLQYLHSMANLNGDSDTIQVSVTDNGNTGAGGGGTVSLGTVNVDIEAFEIGAQIVVSTSEDEDDGNFSAGDLSLREAIALAAVIEGPNVITFDYLFGPLELASSLEIGNANNPFNGDLTILGSGVSETILQGNGTDPIFSFGSYIDADEIAITELRLTGAGNRAVNKEGSDFKLRFDAVEIANNSGTAIYFEDGGELIVENSTIAENVLGDSAAVVVSNASAVFTNTTISGNQSTGSIAGLQVTADGAAKLVNTTITDNWASSHDSEIGVGIHVDSGIVTLHNTIVAGNRGGIDGNALASDIGGTFDSMSSHNLIGYDPDVNNGLESDSDNNIVGVTSAIDPMLAPLRRYSGSTRTHALLAFGPALDAGSEEMAVDASGQPLTMDQRGFTRALDILGLGNEGTNTIDIGAYESNAPIIVTLPDGGYTNQDYSLNDINIKEAITIAANETSNPGLDTIVFDPSLFTSGHLEIVMASTLVVSSNVIIQGPGAGLLTISGGGQRQVFKTWLPRDITIRDLTISQGNASGGGGILNEAHLILERVSIEDNNATAGGGIWANSGSLKLIDSTVAGNTASFAGGGILIGDSDVTIINSTISDNNHYGVYAFEGDKVELINTTVTENYDSGGILFSNGALVAKNSIIAGNFQDAGVTPNDVDGSLNTTLSSYNLIGSGGSGGLLHNTNGNIVLTSEQTAGLAPLGNYGGPTKTHALLEGSPAIDKGNNSTAVAAGISADQRGIPRPVDIPDVGNDGINTIDIGAFEVSHSLVVTTEEDENDDLFDPAFADALSLREALALAKLLPGHNTITFAPLADDEILLTEGHLLIDSEVTIQGPGADQLTIDANFGSRVFDVSSEASAATISGLTITRGYVAGEGGGIRNDADLTLQSVVVVDNEAFDQLGGGIYSGTGASLHVFDSEILGNFSQDGAGVYASPGSSKVLEIEGTTIAYNEAIDSGTPTASAGGIFVNGGTVSIKNTTIAKNSAESGGGLRIQNVESTSIINSTIAENVGDTSGGIFASGTPNSISLYNTIVWGNKLINGTSTDIHGASGVFSTASSYNIVGVKTTSTAFPGIENQNLLDVDPLLAPLGDYGGGRETYALLKDSLAVDGGNPSDDAGAGGVPRFDQRGLGYTRVYDDRIDIGAYEANPNTADIVFIVDESGSMVEEQDWLVSSNVTVLLEQALRDRGFTAPRFAAVGYSSVVPNSETQVVRFIEVNGADFGTAAEFSAAISDQEEGLKINGGGNEDGFWAIKEALAHYDFRAKAPVNVILVTDEDRDYHTSRDLTPDTNRANDTAALVDLFDQHNATLNVIVDATLKPPVSGVYLGLVDNVGNYVAADGFGGFQAHSYASSPSSSSFSYHNPYNSDLSLGDNQDDTFSDYMITAWETSGAAWDINVLSSTDVDLLQSFAAAFVDVKVDEITKPGEPLIEDTRLVTDHAETIDVPSNVDTLRIRFADLDFDVEAGNPYDVNDAFEILVLRPDGSSALLTIGDNSDALFNITQGQTPIWATGVELLNSDLTLVSNPGAAITDGFVQIDISALTPGEEITIVARLVNNDADNTTEVAVKFLTDTILASTFHMLGTGSARILVPHVNQTDQILPGIRFGQLHDVTAAFSAGYSHTTFDSPADLGELTARISLTKQPSPLQVRGDLLLAIKTPVDQDSGAFVGTQLTTFDGRLPYDIDGLAAGTPFVRLSNLLPSVNRFYVDEGVLDDIELTFRHPGNDRFDFEFVVLGELNEPPSFASNPYEDTQGQAYPIDVVAGNGTVQMLEIVAQNGNQFRYEPLTSDPNRDRVRIELIGGPAEAMFEAGEDGFGGVLTWTPDAEEVGVHQFVLRAVDEFGAFDPANDQIVDVRVVDTAFNRPPRFTTTPDTTATFGEQYVYDANAFDPDGDNLEFSGTLGAHPIEYEIEFNGPLPTGFLWEYLTFLSDYGTADGTVTFSNIRIYESDGAGEPQVLKFNPDRFVNYGGTTPGTVEVLGDGSVVRITGNATRAYKFDYAFRSITEKAVIAFTFSAETQGEYHGIGLARANEVSAVDNDRWLQVFGTEELGKDYIDYDPDWPETPDFHVDETSGVVTWNPPEDVRGQWVEANLKVEETDTPELLEDTQPYYIYIVPGDSAPAQGSAVDLTIGEVDVSGVSYDPQRLTASGVITAEVSNLGTDEVINPFRVTFFEDLDFDGVYNPAQDHTLGSTLVEQPLAGGESTTVAAPISGLVQYAGAVIWAFVDSSAAIDETDEMNNYSASNDDCKVVPLPGEFNPVIELTLAQPNYGVMMSPAVMDLDGDSIPEIIYVEAYEYDDFNFEYLGHLRAVNGATGEQLWDGAWDDDIVLRAYSEIAVGDLNSDGLIEIIANPLYATNRLLVIQLDENGQISGTIESSEIFSSHMYVQVAAPSIGNVDTDEDAEVVIGSDVFDYTYDEVNDAYTLTKKDQPNLDVTSYGANLQSYGFGPISILTDLDDDGINEIIVGNAAIKADGTTVWHIEDWINEEEVSVDVLDGYTAIADFTEDGLPEVVLVSQGYVFLLNGQTGDVIWGTELPPMEGVSEPRALGAGAPTIADFDGDGELEIGVAASKLYMVFETDGQLAWTYATEDTTSAATGSSVFDFDGDGKVEIVYGDELALRIFGVPDNLSDPELEVLYELRRPSGTAFELPVIADVDGDGKAEIVAVANDAISMADYHDVPLEYFDVSNGIHVIGDLKDTWLPTRPLWNQHSYHITNINDDGTIPVNEEPSWIVHNTYRLNTLTNPGSDPLDAPDLIPSFVRVQENSGETTYTVRIGNGGSFFAPSGVIIEFYNGDPANGGTLIDYATTIGRIDPGRFEDVSLSVPGSAVGNNELWIVVDPVDPVNQPFGDVRECHEDNNIYNPLLGFVALPVNNDPTIDSVPFTKVVAGETYHYNVDASDPDAGQSDHLVYELAAKPAGMWINSATGEIAWTPTVRQLQRDSHFVMVRVRDGHGGQAVQSFYVQIVSDNVAPEIDAGLAPSAALHEGWLFQPTATDGNNDLLTYELRLISPFLTTESKPEIDRDTGIITWTDPPRVGDFTMQVTVSDGRGGRDSAMITIPVRDGNTSPYFIFDPIEPVILGEEWRYELVADDLESPNDLTFTIDAAARARGIELDPVTDELAWTPTTDAPATVIVTVTDAGGLSSQARLNLPVNVRTVPIGQNEAPHFDSEPRPDAIALAGRPWKYLVQLTDIDGDDIDITEVSINGELQDLQEVLTTLVDAAGQHVAQFQWTPSLAGYPNGWATIQFTATDGPATSWQVIDLPVLANSAPIVISAVPSATAVLGEVEDYEFEVVDFEGGPLRLELVSPAPGTGKFTTNGTNTITSILASTNPESPASFYLQFTPEALGQQEVTVRITDAGGKKVEHTIHLDVFQSGLSTLSQGELHARTVAAVDEQFIAQVLGHDEDGDTPIYKFLVGTPGNYTYADEIGSETYDDGVGPDEIAPTGMWIDSATGVITWTPTLDQLDDVFTYAIAIVDETDPQQYSLIPDVKVTVVQQFSNTAPRITSSPAGISAAGGKPLIYQATAVDDENDPVTWQLNSGPATASISAQGLFTWNPSPDEAGLTQTAVIQVTDPSGFGQQQEIILKVDSNFFISNTAPRIVSTPTNPGIGDETYTYVVRAIDEEGHAITYSLEGANLSGASLIPNEADGTATFIWLSPQADETRDFTFIATDELGLSSEQTIRLTIGSGSGSGQVDTPPTIHSRPPQVVELGNDYVYQVSATDPDGPVTYSVAAEWLEGGTGPVAGFSINGDGLITWDTSGEDIGIIRVILKATQNGVSAVQSYVLQVVDANINPNPRPVLGPPVPLEATPGQAFTFAVPGADPLGEPVEFFFKDGTGNLTHSIGDLSISANGRVTWQVPTDIPIDDERTFTVELRDSAGQLSTDDKLYTITIVSDRPPTIGLSATTLRPEAGTTVGFTVIAQDDLGVQDRRLTITQGANTINVPIAANGAAQFTIPLGTPVGTQYTVEAVAIDTTGQASQTATLTLVVRAADVGMPIVEITSPDNGIVLEQGTNLMGRIIDPDNQLVFYSITATPSGGGAPINLVTKEAPVGDYLTNVGVGAPVALAGLSPFALARGAYKIEIVARDASGKQTSSSIIIGIEANVTLGNFSLSFTDMTVNVGGMPITITRTYDTLDANTRGDFGYGWSLDVLTGKLEYVRAGDDFNDFKDFLGYDQAITAGSRLTVTLPNGEVHGFTAVPVGINLDGSRMGALGGIFTRADMWALAFQPDPGQNSRLDFASGLDAAGNVKLSETQAMYYPGEFQDLMPGALFDRAYGSVTVIYNEETGEFNLASTAGKSVGVPANFSTIGGNLRLITRDETEFEFDSATGQLLRAKNERFGKSMSFTGDSIVARDNNNQEIGRLTILREDPSNSGLITRIENGLGFGVNYIYDENDDLIAVRQEIDLPESQDPRVRETEFVYDTDESLNGNNGEPHYLRHIIDPQDRLIAAVEFDEDGRIKKTATGDVGTPNANSQEVTYDPALGNQTVVDAFGVQTTYEFDARGNIDRIVQYTDENGPYGGQDVIWQFTHDYKNRITSQTDPEGRVSTWKYGVDGRQITVIEPHDPEDDSAEFTTVIRHNEQGFVESISGSHGRTEFRIYSELGDLTALLDESGYVFSEWEYADSGELLRESSEAGTTTYEYIDRNHTRINTPTEAIDAFYDKIGQLTSFADDGGTSTLAYDGLGRVAQAVYDDGELTVNYEYGIGGVEQDWTSLSSASTGTIGREFTSSGQLGGWSLANGGEVQYIYDRGRLDKEIDPLGRVTQYLYDELGRVREIQDLASGNFVRYTYDLAGRILDTENALGETTNYTYGNGNHPETVTDARGYTTIFDTTGLVSSTTGPYLGGVPTPVSRTTQVLRDAAGLPTAFLNADGTQTTIGYRNSDVLGDAAQFPTFIRDESGRERRFTYFDDGRLKSATDLAGVATTLGYDPDSLRLETVDLPGPGEVIYQYNEDGRIISIERPGLGTYTVSEFNADGQPKEITLPSGEEVSLTYDDAGRLITRDVDNGESASFDYTVTNAIDQYTDNTGTTDYIYYSDSNPQEPGASYAGRLQKIVYPNGTSVEYTYDVLGRVATLTTRASTGGAAYTTNYTYDSVGNVETVLDPFGGLTEYTYDELGRLETRTLPNGVVTTWTFDNRDRLLSIVHRNSGGTVISSFTYEHPSNAVGEPHKITREDGSYVKLFYDPALRIEREEYYSSSDVLQRKIEYAYDAAGNRTSRTIDSNVDTYNLNAESGYELDSISGANPATFGYDNGGRLTSLIRGSTDATLVYNSSGQITSIDNETGTDYTYSYDVLGQRTGATDTTGSTREFLVAPAAQRLGAGALDVTVQHLAADGSGNVLIGWVYAGENPILRFDSAGNVQYYLEDASDSVAALINAAQTKTADYRYDAFGNLLAGSATPTSAAGGDFGFHAAWLEEATGLYDMRARTYDPETGRFTSPDPATPNPQFPETFEPYSFANNNPHLFSDPTGLFSLVEVNVTQAIQNTLQSLKTAVIQAARREVVNEVEEFATKVFVESLQGLLPDFFPDFARGIRDAGKGFAKAFEDVFSEFIPEPFKSYLWLEPSVTPSGKAVNGGLNARNLPNGLRTFVRGEPRPDYIINSDDPASDDADLSWLIGDFAISGNTLYKKYISPGDQREQWDAITNHARDYGLRISVFFTFWSIDKENAFALQQKMISEGFEKGELIYIVSLKQSSQSKLSWSK